MGKQFLPKPQKRVYFKKHTPFFLSSPPILAPRLLALHSSILTLFRRHGLSYTDAQFLQHEHAVCHFATYIFPSLFLSNLSAKRRMTTQRMFTCT